MLIQYNDKVKRHAARYPVKIDQERSAYDWSTASNIQTTESTSTDYVAKFQCCIFPEVPLYHLSGTRLRKNLSLSQINLIWWWFVQAINADYLNRQELIGAAKRQYAKWMVLIASYNHELSRSKYHFPTSLLHQSFTPNERVIHVP